jgi:hypothetical protein
VRQRLEPLGEPVTAVGALEAAERFVGDLLTTAESFKWKAIEATTLFCMPNPNDEIDRLTRKYDRETMGGLLLVVELVEGQSGRQGHEAVHRSLDVFLKWLDMALRTVLSCRWVTLGYMPQGDSADLSAPVLSPKNSTADIVRLRETYETDAAPAFQATMRAIRDISAAEAEQQERAGVASGGATCVVCLEARPVMACVPCGHVCACVKCAAPIQKCPICRTDGTMVRLFFP